MIQLIVYDIEDDKARSRVAALLEGYGRRVQKSVFECRLGERELGELTKRLQKEIGRASDGQVRVYRVCGRCFQGSFGLGDLTQTDEQDCYIV